MNILPAASGALGLLFIVAYVVFIIYCVLRFLNAVDRGVAAHERIAQEMGRRGDGGRTGGFGTGGT